MLRIAVSIKAESRYCASGMTVQNRPEYSFNFWHVLCLILAYNKVDGKGCIGISMIQYDCSTIVSVK